MVTVTKDEGPRKSNLEGLMKLRPSFKPDGSSTAGNSSQMSDGAAAVLLASRAAAYKHHLPIIGRFVGFCVKGCHPEIMGVGPAIAIPEVLKRHNLKIEDIGTFEINEAFASQSVYCREALKIPKEKVNPCGGAIALGHPLGCTGAYLVAKLFPQLKRNN